MHSSTFGCAVMESASKVKVEYTDPSNIFTTFASELNPRLPLRELHWSSSSRPTRSIGSLHLELVSDENSKSSAAPSSTESSIGNQDNGVPPNSEGPKKERRHQIPGLLRTPYLKVYLISCNDIETYKGSYRKQLREWVKENTPQSQSSAALNKQDNHDAFEWLIIHVVSSSGTGSSNTSRPASIKGDGPAEKRPNSSRWSSRNSTSVVEKLRSDFNGMSKTAIGRVAQVQLVEPSSDGTPQVDRRAQDSPNGWDDLIFKTKSLILSSFDLRVSQYEDDIREREGQKKVFGWNFNTFFVLKEGLAMGFESMGLLEDALTVYRELSFGLRSAIEEQQIEGAEQQTAHFVDYTQDLYESFEHAGTAGIQTSFEDSSIRKRLLDPGASLLDTNRKPFRDLILSNKISVYDFQCYIFARQSVLSLRLANKDIKQRRVERRNGPGDDDEYLSDNADLSKPSDHEPENLLILAEIVKSTIGFITATARIVREDIECAITQSEPSQKGIGESKSRVYGEKTEDFVMSWLFSASQCVLEATSARSLTAQLSPLLRQVKPRPDSPEARADGQQDANNVEVGQHKDLPTRTSSLPSKNPARPLSPPNGQFLSLNSLDAAKLLPPGNPHPGSQTLAAERGELIALLRRVLSSLAIRHGCWEGGLADITFNPRWHEEELGIIELNDNLEPEKSANTSPLIHAKDSSAAGLCNADLLSAVISSTDFYSLHEVRPRSTWQRLQY